MKQISDDNYLQSNIMKVIIYEGVNQFKNKKCESNSEDVNITKYIKQHKFYNEQLCIEEIVKQIKQRVRKNASENNEIKSKIQQLCLYLNNEKNKSMFQIYEIVLKNPKGVTYKTIDNKLNIGIVSVSHYCCRLKKMNFVDLRHQKNEKVVFSKDACHKKNNQQDDQTIKKTQSQPFHFSELSMVDNIWINVSGYESYKKNGITNEDIKQKLSKTSQTKLIMKVVDQVKDTYQFDKQIVSEGKVFQNRFRNVTKSILKISKGQIVNSPQNELEQKLNPKIQQWLKEKFPQYEERKFLFTLVNTQLKDYFTVDGLKSAKRDCTPIKLIRYIKILNSLNNRYPQTHIQLKNYIIDQEKETSNGTMHKRSILGILDGLVTKGILKKTSIYYYPLWEPDGLEVSIQKNEEQDYDEAIISRPKKKVKLSSLTTKQQLGKKINLNQYKKQLKIKLLCAILQQYEKSIIKYGFKRVRKAKLFEEKKNKTEVRIYEPQVHILSLLEGQNYKKVPKLKVNNYEELTQRIDEFIQNEGEKEERVNVNYQVIKLLRRAGKIKESELKNRFGNNWQQKISVLQETNIVEKQQEGVWALKNNQRYYI